LHILHLIHLSILLLVCLTFKYQSICEKFFWYFCRCVPLNCLCPIMSLQHIDHVFAQPKQSFQWQQYSLDFIVVGQINCNNMNKAQLFLSALFVHILEKQQFQLEFVEFANHFNSFPYQFTFGLVLIINSLNEDGD
jgi:hypothetical protein